MTRYCLLIVLLLAFDVRPSLGDADATTSAGEMEGVWCIVSDLGTDKVSVDETVLYVFSGARFTCMDLKPRGRVLTEWSSYPLRVNEKATPKEIDITDRDEKTKKALVQKSIYRVKKPGLVEWCLGPFGEERPKEFKGEKKIVCIHLKRIAKSLEDYKAKGKKGAADATKRLYEKPAGKSDKKD